MPPLPSTIRTTASTPTCVQSAPSAGTSCASAHLPGGDLARYQDRYTQKLTQLIEAKVAGQEIVAAPATTQVQVINLVEALRQSVAETQKAASKKEKPDAGSAKKKTAPAKTKPAASRKRSLATAAVV
jgi:hypothetical protein